jgi:hypothetical protein
MKMAGKFRLPRGPVVRLWKAATVLGKGQPEQPAGVYRNWLEAVDVAINTWPVTPDNDYVIRDPNTGQVRIWLSHVPDMDGSYCVLTHYYADDLLYSERYTICLAMDADGRGCTQVTWINTEI